VTAVITVPASLDEPQFEQVIDQLAAVPADAKLLVDARHCRFATPYGLTGLLCLAQARAARPDFVPPDDDDVRSYWARSQFFTHADLLYTLLGNVPRRQGGNSDVLLEVTPVRDSADVQTVVARIQEQAAHILTRTLDP